MRPDPDGPVRPGPEQDTGRLLPYGDRAVLVELDDLRGALAVHARLEAATQRVAGLADVVVGARTVLLVADSPGSLPAVRAAAREALVAGRTPEPGPTTPDGASAPHPLVEVPVHYDGADLTEVAGLTGLSVPEVVAAHTGTPWSVAFAGFAPGFAYLVDGDPRLRVPRRSSPRTRVPAGAVGLADEFSGIYPRSSPGGWQLLGHTDLALWDLDRDPPALLRPGLRVRFRDADADR